MSMFSAPRRSLTAATVLAALFAVQPVLARDRHTTVTGAGGQTAQRDVNRSRGDVSSTATGPAGHTRSRSVDRSKAGTTSSVTGANGQTATRSTAVSAGSPQ